MQRLRWLLPVVVAMTIAAVPLVAQKNASKSEAPRYRPR